MRPFSIQKKIVKMRCVLALNAKSYKSERQGDENFSTFVINVARRHRWENFFHHVSAETLK